MRPHYLARLLAAVPIALTMIPLTRTGKGWVRIWDFPRLQIAALGLTAYPVFRVAGGGSAPDVALQAVLGACIGYQVYRIHRYTPFHPKEVQRVQDDPPERRVSLLIANVLMSNRRATTVLELVRRIQPDIVCLAEPDEWWQQQLRPLEDEYPYVNHCPLDNTYGMLLYSRLPFVSVETRYLLQPCIPSMKALVRLRSGDEVMLYAIHPEPPLPGTDSYGRDAELMVVAAEAHKEKRPTIVMGDLNDVAWSHTTALFQKTAEMLDPRVGRGFYNTFHAHCPVLRYPLDHVFHTRDFRLVRLQRLPDIGSDHFPILAELAYSPAARVVQSPPQATQDDHEQAREIVKDARENGLDPPPLDLEDA
jgi:endonuclease/exonuclease/phosphatase (EEP) superfamily protein YafD